MQLSGLIACAPLVVHVFISNLLQGKQDRPIQAPVAVKPCSCTGPKRREVAGEPGSGKASSGGAAADAEEGSEAAMQDFHQRLQASTRLAMAPDPMTVAEAAVDRYNLRMPSHGLHDGTASVPLPQCSEWLCLYNIWHCGHATSRSQSESELLYKQGGGGCPARSAGTEPGAGP